MSAPIRPTGATAAAAPRTATPRQPQPQEGQPQERQPQEQPDQSLMAAVVQQGYGTSGVLHLARIPGRRSRPRKSSSGCMPPGWPKAPGTS